MRRLMVIGLATYVGVCVIIRWVQSRLIYFPTHNCHTTPADLGIEFEDLTLTTKDGIAISAWYLPHPTALGTIIFCHGNAGNIADRVPTGSILRSLGCNVLLFDYRGYGRSGGTPTEEGTYLDAQAAWDYVKGEKREPPGRIVVFGRSLGGAVAIELAVRCAATPPAALVLDSTFTSVTDIGRMHYPFLPVNWLLRYRYESIDKIGRIDVPKLFFHGRKDELIPIENGRRLFDAAADPKQFVETPGGHNTGGFDYSPQYTAQLASFIQTHLRAAGP